MNVYQQTISNDLRSLDGLIASVAGFLKGQGVEDQPIYSIRLALEEVITNTIKYGYSDDFPHEIHVSLEVGQEKIDCGIEDDGHEFNPLAQKEVDLDQPVENRPIGGLGIHLLKKLLDSIDYRREGGRNILRFSARRNPPGTT